MKSRLIIIGLGAAALAVSQGCSSSNGLAPDASSASSVSSTFNALEGLLFDSASSSSKLSSHGLSNVGNFSPLGCHYRQDRARMFDSVTQVRRPLCYISTLEEGNVGFSLGVDEYNYYTILNTPHGDDPAPVDFKIRLGKFSGSNGKKCLKYQICNDGTQTEDFEVCEIDGGVTADVRNSRDTHSHSMLLTALGNDSEGVTSATIENAFSDGFGSGNAKFTGDKATQENTFLGKFAFSFTDPVNSNTFTGDTGVCVYAGGGVGSGKVSGDSTFPAFSPDNTNYYCPGGPGNPPITALEGDTCDFSFANTESFEMSSATPPVITVIADADSPWFPKVKDCVLPTTIGNPSGFQNTWDCSGTFTKIDMGDVDVTSCDKIGKDFEQNGDDNCEQQQREAEKDALPPPT